jgi:hypothetical protein
MNLGRDSYRSYYDSLARLPCGISRSIMYQSSSITSEVQLRLYILSTG